MICINTLDIIIQKQNFFFWDFQHTLTGVSKNNTNINVTMTIILHVAFIRRYNYRGKPLALLQKFESF